MQPPRLELVLVGASRKGRQVAVVQDTWCTMGLAQSCCRFLPNSASSARQARTPQTLPRRSCPQVSRRWVGCSCATLADSECTCLACNTSRAAPKMVSVATCSTTGHQGTLTALSQLQKWQSASSLNFTLALLPLRSLHGPLNLHPVRQTKYAPHHDDIAIATYCKSQQTLPSLLLVSPPPVWQPTARLQQDAHDWGVQC